MRGDIGFDLSKKTKTKSLYQLILKDYIFTS